MGKGRLGQLIMLVCNEETLFQHQFFKTHYFGVKISGEVAVQLLNAVDVVACFLIYVGVTIEGFPTPET